MKLILPTLLLSTLSLFAMHPLNDYTECQQPYIEKVRDGDAQAFKSALVACRAKLWNEDMTSYSNYNYRKFSTTTLTCAGDVHAKELLRGHKRSLAYAATLYRLSAQKGDRTAQKNLVELSNAGNDVIFNKGTKEAYTKILQDDKELTFIQIMLKVPSVKKEDRETFRLKYTPFMQTYVESCTNALKVDLDALQKEQEMLNEYNDNLQAQTFDADGNLIEPNIDKKLRDAQNNWLNIENRVLSAEERVLKGALREYSKLSKHMSKK